MTYGRLSYFDIFIIDRRKWKNATGVLANRTQMPAFIIDDSSTEVGMNCAIEYSGYLYHCVAVKNVCMCQHIWSTHAETTERSICRSMPSECGVGQLGHSIGGKVYPTWPHRKPIAWNVSIILQESYRHIKCRWTKNPVTKERKKCVF